MEQNNLGLPGWNAYKAPCLYTRPHPQHHDRDEILTIYTHEQVPISEKLETLCMLAESCTQQAPREPEAAFLWGTPEQAMSALPLDTRNELARRDPALLNAIRGDLMYQAELAGIPFEDLDRPRSFVSLQYGVMESQVLNEVRASEPYDLRAIVVENTAALVHGDDQTLGYQWLASYDVPTEGQPRGPLELVEARTQQLEVLPISDAHRNHAYKLIDSLHQPLHIEGGYAKLESGADVADRAWMVKMIYDLGIGPDECELIDQPYLDLDSLLDQ